MKKYVEVPVRKYLYLFLEKEYETVFTIDHNSNKVLELKKRINLFSTDNRNNYRLYLDKVTSDYVSVKMLSHHSRPDYLFAFVCSVKHMFKNKMHQYIALRHGMVEHSQSIRDFLLSYYIYESDYSFATAYKSWQRSPEYKSIINQQRNDCDIKACG